MGLLENMALLETWDSPTIYMISGSFNLFEEKNAEAMGFGFRTFSDKPP